MILEFCKPANLRFYLRSVYGPKARFELWAIEGTTFAASARAANDPCFLQLSWEQFVDMHDKFELDTVVVSNIDLTSVEVRDYIDVVGLFW